VRRRHNTRENAAQALQSRKIATFAYSHVSICKSKGNPKGLARRKKRQPLLIPPQKTFPKEPAISSENADNVFRKCGAVSRLGR